MRPEGPRDKIVGPDDGPQPPFPLYLSGTVIKGFGRGSKELGIPTANIPIEGLSVGGHSDIQSGVYFGWAGLEHLPNGDQQASPSPEQRAPSGPKNDEAARASAGAVYPMVMSIGWNPFYKNTVRSVEVHILHAFHADFYGAVMNLIILGFIRPEYDYVDRESLVQDIREDIEVARRSLGRGAWARFGGEGYLVRFRGEGHGDVAA